MRLFGYYALHSFLNQLKKLFKTWVLVFILICGLLGALIGVGAAMLEDTIEENNPKDSTVQEAETTTEEESRYSLSISQTELIELAAGGIILALFTFEAVSSDKNGGKIFLPADVNLLFPSPMKPQSVLMFRLATQLGTALAGTIWLMFQLPNMIWNLGLPGWTAIGILIAWFAAILVGKLLQVLLYTVCSTNISVKRYLGKSIYAILGTIAVFFLIYYKASGNDLLFSANSFFNAPFTRWIPFWGWLKGLPAAIAEHSFIEAAIYVLLLIISSVAFVYAIWHINADFYEDAMAKSEETAALLEKARSEKTSGTAVTRQRKKDRKDSILRDGFHYGQGANVFFYKTIYNRFRFAHLGFFTKTMETYLVVALGTAAALRFYFGYINEIPVMLALGAFVFFRAMGNPLTEDTGMDFFRMIPESTWQKLFFSLLGGTANTLLDLIPPVLGASLVLMINPLRFLVWLPLIISVDFYATSVVTFIDLSVPASIGKTIKQFITILFIYFGLLPDIGLIGFGMAMGHTTSAAIGSCAVNLALGVSAFSLASVFLQPKGKDYYAGVKQDLHEASRKFSRVGWAYVSVILLSTLFQIILSYVFGLLGFEAENNPWALWLITFAPEYLVAFPAGILLLRKIPAATPTKNSLGIARGCKFFLVCTFMMYAGNLIGNLLTWGLGLIRDQEIINPLMNYAMDDNTFARILFMVILAPVFEEYFFRKQLIDRLKVYGGKTAVVISALLFGLIHGNLSQFFYAFGLGLVFGYIYLNTGNLKNTVIAHMVVNFVGGVLSVWLADHAYAEDAAQGWKIAFTAYTAAIIICSIIGLVLFFMNYRNLTFPRSELELPKGKKFRVTCMNAGMMIAFTLSIALMILSIVQ